MNYEPTETPNDPVVERELRRLSGILRLKDRLLVVAVAPTKPAEGQVLICNGTTWNPIGDGIKRPVWYDAEAQVWKTFS